MTEKELRHQVVLDAGVLGNPMWGGERITNLLNQAQQWLQPLLVKSGSLNWLTESTDSFTNATLFGKAVSSTPAPTTRLVDAPIMFVRHSTLTKPAREVDLNNFIEEVDNTVTKPSTTRAIFVLRGSTIFVYPQLSGGDTASQITYHKRVTDLVYDDESTQCEIPVEKQPILIERVVAQIISANGGEQIAQAKQAKIDKELVEKFQLLPAVTNTDKDLTQ